MKYELTASGVWVQGTLENSTVSLAMHGRDVT